jgi:hypothetical protein
MRRRTAVALFAVGLLALARGATAQVTTGPRPLATGPTNWPGVTIDLVSVERKGSVLTVKWAVKSTAGKTETVQFELSGKPMTTFLLDEESGTKYYALTDKEGNTLASEHAYAGGGYGISDYLEAGATNRYWAKFPAPPAAVKTINIFFTNSDPFEGVAITDKP